MMRWLWTNWDRGARDMLWIVSLSLALLAGCPPQPPTPPPQPELDAGDGTCDSACAKLRELGCAEAKPTAEGNTCEQVCLNVQSSGVVSWNLGCRSKIASCAQIDSCEPN